MPNAIRCFYCSFGPKVSVSEAIVDLLRALELCQVEDFFGAGNLNHPNLGFVNYPWNEKNISYLEGKKENPLKSAEESGWDMANGTVGCFRKWWVFPPNHPF